ncbi:energy transducer TonB [Desertivirga xinjiangensis]|uniref:energy transducer TonB n=1 Tax=Desertivirga xinjiangensis TaxID=539206 RepID=UPI002108677A|nr:energy transducer TonB [Pedobacter xinjiangensis]
MAKLDIFDPVWLEVVFTGRNQSYGAFVLRKDNNRTTTRALFIGAIVFALLVCSPLIVKYIQSLTGNVEMVEEDKVDVTEVVLTPPPPVDEQAPPPPPAAEPPKPRVDQVRFPPPVVVPAEQVREEEPPSQEELAVKDPGQKTIEGDPNAQIRIDEPVGEAPPTQAAVVEDNSVHDFATIEVQPEFPGGIQKFYDYVGKTYNYPAAAKEQGVSGRVILSFVVEKDGSLTDIKVLRDLGMGTGEEAIRVLKKSKKWNPGIQNGRPVRVNYTIPILLNLEAQ